MSPPEGELDKPKLWNCVVAAFPIDGVGTHPMNLYETKYWFFTVQFGAVALFFLK